MKELALHVEVFSPVAKREREHGGCCALPSQFPVSVGRRKPKTVSNGKYLNAEGWEDKSR